MKTRKHIYQSYSDAASLTFCDVVAHFSEEEWKLLHHWQKELYQNVMKEIQQALSSLGPLIATSVFSLRPNEKEAMCLIDSPDIEIKGTIHTSSRATAAESDVLLMGNQYLNTTLDQNKEEICDGPSAGPAETASFVTFTVKGEDELHFIDHCEYNDSENLSSTTASQIAKAVSGSNSIEQLNTLSTQAEGRTCEKHSDTTVTIKHNCGFPVQNIQADTNLEDVYCAGREGSSMYLNSGAKVSTSRASIGINEQGEVYPIDVQACWRREPLSNPSGNESMKRKKAMDNTLKVNHKTKLGKSTSKKPNTNLAVLERKNSMSQKYLECDQELRQNEDSSNEYSNVDEKLPLVERSKTYSTSEKTIRNQNNIPCDSNPLQSFGPYLFPENEQTSQKNIHIGPQKAHRVKRKYACIHCGKSFNATSSLLTHERIHTGERPFRCAICGKSFNQTGVLYRHQKMHTGERPYQCNLCGKRFNLKHHLLGHQKIHSKVQHNSDTNFLENV